MARHLAPASNGGRRGLLLSHLQLLDSMSPEGFLEFRDPLDPASGFQSFQFRAIEFLSGAAKLRCLPLRSSTIEQRAWLKEMSELPSVWAGFEHSLRTTLGAANDDLLDTLRALYLSHDDPRDERTARRRRTTHGPRRTIGDLAPPAHDDGRSSDWTPTGAPEAVREWPISTPRWHNVCIRPCGK